jgi:tRNA pseudouridine synthase 10
MTPSPLPPSVAAFPEPEHTSAAARVLAQAHVGDHCLGRLYGKLGTGMGNDERGRRLRAELGRDATPESACQICDGLFGELDHLAALVADALEGIEHRTFLIGSRVDPDVVAREQQLASLGDPAWSEPVTGELNREVGKRVAARTLKEADGKKPDVTAVVDTRFDVVALQVAPVFLYARYRKFSREIPQTRWPCRDCKGRGCAKCNLTGKQYMTSVQELVMARAVEAFRARDADFHGMGREDIDARCIGTGRPFILELREPHVRDVDLPKLEEAINAHARPRVEIEGLRLSQRDEVAWVKQADSVKEYRARVTFAAPVDEANLYQALIALRGAAVAQRTPSRVEHRRAMLTRQRAVHDVALERFAPQDALVRIRGEAGLYIKELVSGDDGRTRPNLSELLGTQARVVELDVIGVEEPPRGA